MGNLVDIRGNRVQRVPCIEWSGHDLPAREVDLDSISKPEVLPKVAAMVAITQMNDQNSILWAGLAELAKDIYSVPGSSRHFLNFVKSMQLTLKDVDGKKIELASIIEPVQN